MAETHRHTNNETKPTHDTQNASKPIPRSYPRRDPVCCQQRQHKRTAYCCQRKNRMRGHETPTRQSSERGWNWQTNWKARRQETKWKRCYRLKRRIHAYVRNWSWCGASDEQRQTRSTRSERNPSRQTAGQDSELISAAMPRRWQQQESDHCLRQRQSVPSLLSCLSATLTQSSERKVRHIAEPSAQTPPGLPKMAAMPSPRQWRQA